MLEVNDADGLGAKVLRRNAGVLDRAVHGGA